MIYSPGTIAGPHLGLSVHRCVSSRSHAKDHAPYLSLCTDNALLYQNKVSKKAYLTFLATLFGTTRTVGILTRDSVRKAYRNGIKAQQLAYFLKIHAHPRMAEAGTDKEPSAFPPIPGTVIHQLFLWEQERKR